MITLTDEQALQIEDALANTAEFSAAEQFAREQKAIATIRAARAQEQAEQEPVHWVVPDFGFLFPSEDAAQRYLINIESDAKPTPCYAAPARTKDLTDDEIDRIACNVSHKEFARAVIAADREKNK